MKVRRLRRPSEKKHSGKKNLARGGLREIGVSAGGPPREENENKVLRVTYCFHDKGIEGVLLSVGDRRLVSLFWGKEKDL